MEPLNPQEYRARLLAGGIPPARVERSLRELQDHRDDLVRAAGAQGVSEADSHAVADLQLGDPAVLATAMLSRPELKSRLHRHPVLMLLVLPLLTYLLTSLVLVASTVVIGVWQQAVPVPELIREGTSASPRWLAVTLMIEQIIVTYVLIPLLASGLTYVCIRQHVKVLHRKIAVLLLCLVGSGFELIVEWYDAAGPGLNVAFLFVYTSDRLDPSDTSLAINALRLTGYLVLSGLFARYCVARERQRSRLC